VRDIISAMQARPRDERPIDGARADELDALSDALRPRVNRARILARLDELFRSGKSPDPRPDGALPGRPLTTAVWGPADRLALRLADLWMPWNGKRFAPDSESGVNRFDRSVIGPMHILWPGYRPEPVAGGIVEAFAFRTRIGPGTVDPDVTVLAIDYDAEANPSFLIRRILDELVEVAPGRYLGKVLFRVRGSFHPIGFFSLRLP
jgi:hypothetical protein